MPVIEQSPPLLFGEGEQPPVTPPIMPPIIPPVTPPVTPPTTTPPGIIIMPGTCNLSDIVKNHRVFVGHVNTLNKCFRRDDMPEFSDQDFEFHKELSTIDKFIVPNENYLCSMQAIQNLSDKLKRIKD